MDYSNIKQALSVSGLFDGQWYLDKYFDSKESEVDPLDDYLQCGVEEGRDPNPLFSNDFYLKNSPDLPPDVNPLYHFSTQGWKEFRSPSESFNILWYLVKNLNGVMLDINPLLHFIEVGASLGFTTTIESNKSFSVNEKSAFNNKCIELFNSASLNPTIAGNLSRAAAQLRQYDLADMFAVKACELDSGSFQWHMQLGRVLVKRSGWSRLLQVMQCAKALEPECAEVYQLLGLANEKLERFHEASVAYRKLIELANSVEAQWYYRLGVCEEELGDLDKSAKSFKLAAERTENLNEELGLGGLHEQMEAWARAENAYARIIDAGNGSSEIYIKHGLMCDISYEWDKAEISYRTAISLDSTNPIAWYRFAELLERKGDFSESAISYEKACRLNKTSALDWRYRQGYVLWQLDEDEKATESWLMALKPRKIEAQTYSDSSALEKLLSESRQDAQLHFNLGHVYEREGRLSDAAKSFEEAAARRNDYSADDYYHAGRLLAKLGRFKEAAEALSEIREFKKPFLLSKSIEGDFDVKKTYAEYLDNLEIRSDLILYESYHGASVSCNPFAMFRSLLADSRYSDYIHIWAVKELDCIPKEYASKKNVIFVRHGSSLYLRYLATARWLINNNTFFPYFLRRTGQSYLNTWHGTPMKSLGVDIPGIPFDHKNGVRNILQSTHIIYPNKHALESVLKGYQGDEIYSGKLAYTGYPRIDLMLNCDLQRKNQIKSILGIDNGKPIVLYAPTWRGHAKPEIDIEHFLEDVEQLSKQPVNIVVSAHHLIFKALESSQLPVVMLGRDIDTTEFLSVVDVLITDYSSILFDYLPLRRPVLLYTYDLDEYQAKRGLYFDLSTLPAKLCESLDILLKSLEYSLENFSVHANHDKAIVDYCPKEDGFATKRAIDFFFLDKGVESSPYLRNDKRKLLFYAGSFIPNGITSAFLRLVSLLPKDEYSITLAVDPWVMESYPQRMQRISELPKHVNVLGRISFPVGCEEDEYINRLFQKRKGIIPDCAKEKLIRYYRREYIRMYGNAKFDAVLDFCGYNYYWAALLSLGRPKGTPSAMWLHNDMGAEVKFRFPYLRNILSLAENFDRLVSVSADSHQVNSENLTRDYGVAPHKLCYVRNSIDPKWLNDKAMQPLSDEISVWAGKSTLIGSVGRLSREKAQDRVINAFAEICNRYPDAKLVIAGQGPELGYLTELVRKSGLSDRIRLVGFLENPYPLFRRLDLFVLPSDYEGQGIVLLEALALGCSVMSTDIPGPREILEEVGGRLVDKSQLGVRQGLELFLSGDLKKVNFDCEKYVKTSISDFSKVLDNIFPS